MRAVVADFPSGDGRLPQREYQVERSPLQVLGRISALSFGAHAALDRASSGLDRFAAARIAGEGKAALQDLLIKADIATSQAQIVIIDAALEATTIVFDALGVRHLRVAPAGPALAQRPHARLA